MLQETQNDPQEAPRRVANEHPEAPGAENHKMYTLLESFKLILRVTLRQVLRRLEIVLGQVQDLQVCETRPAFLRNVPS